MAQNKVLVTQKGLDSLEAELNNLIHVIRKEVIVELQDARAQGDLSENADYDAAREHQARVEQRIQELENMLSNVELISDEKQESSVVKLGSTVKIKDMADNTEETYDIVGSVESDPLNGKLSNQTPLAVAIMDHKVGDVISIINVDEPYKVKILELK